jgi:hypothetical protein
MRPGSASAGAPPGRGRRRLEGLQSLICALALAATPAGAQNASPAKNSGSRDRAPSIAAKPDALGPKPEYLGPIEPIRISKETRTKMGYIKLAAGHFVVVLNPTNYVSSRAKVKLTTVQGDEVICDLQTLCRFESQGGVYQETVIAPDCDSVCTLSVVISPLPDLDAKRVHEQKTRVPARSP